jgi:hypothetical protein
MSVRRLVSVLSVCLIASATAVVAQPKDGAPVAPAKDPAAPAGSAAGSDAGSAVQMAEDPPPSDMEGTNENPDAPKTGDGSGDAAVKKVAAPIKKAGYPIEQSQRPITLPANMSEVSIGPHAQIKPYAGTDALRARYGITREVQLGLTYVLGGIYDDPKTVSDKIGFHPGKAVGLDVTVLLQNWIAVKVGVPVYIDPLAFGLQLAAPLKFILTDKLAIGGMDDFLTIKLSKFAPTFYQEVQNVANGEAARLGTASRGYMRFSGFAEYQHSPKMALIGRFGVVTDLGTGGGGAAGTSADSSATTFIRAGFQYSPRKFLDLGLSIGWDDLAHVGTFAPAGFLAVRI